jgi:hypothetical protein
VADDWECMCTSLECPWCFDEVEEKEEEDESDDDEGSD